MEMQGEEIVEMIEDTIKLKQKLNFPKLKTIHLTPKEPHKLV